DCR
ncbi:ATP-dependent DNA helicase RecQ, partial [Vibrio parahaemolyticus VPTS-2010]